MPTAWYRISLRENPQAKPTEAIQLSRQMMNGNKWRCFVLDLTLYLHWTFLPTLLASILGTGIGMLTGRIVLCQSIATVAVGLLSLLFVNGYKSAAYTALYAALRQAQLDSDAPLSSLFTVPAFGEAAPEGPGPSCPTQTCTCPRTRCSISPSSTSSTTTGATASARSSCCFFAFSIAGWLWEVALHIVTKGMFVNRGTMLGPWAADLRRRRRDRAVSAPPAVYQTGGDLLCIHGAVLGHRVFHQLVP